MYKSRTERARLVRARRLRHCLALLPDRPLAPCPCLVLSVLSSSQTTPSHHRSRRCHHANRSHYRKAQEEVVARPFSGPWPWCRRWLRLLVSHAFFWYRSSMQLTHGYLRYGYHLKHGMIQCLVFAVRLLTNCKSCSPTSGDILSKVGEAEAGGIRMSGKNLDLDWPFRLCIQPVIHAKDTACLHANQPITFSIFYEGLKLSTHCQLVSGDIDARMEYFGTAALLQFVPKTTNKSAGIGNIQTNIKRLN